MKFGSVFVCRSISLFEHLRNKGYMPFRTSYDIARPERRVWLFDNSDELEAIAEAFKHRFD